MHTHNMIQFDYIGKIEARMIQKGNKATWPKREEQNPLSSARPPTPLRNHPSSKQLLYSYSINIIIIVHTKGGGIQERCFAARPRRQRIPSSSARPPPPSPIPPSYTISIIYSNITATEGGDIQERCSAARPRRTRIPSSPRPPTPSPIPPPFLQQIDIFYFKKL